MISNRITTAVSKHGKAIISRIMPGIDLMQGIRIICRRNAVTSGVVVSGIGSLRQAAFIYVVSDPKAPVGASYVTPHRIDGPIELLGLQGSIGLAGDDIDVHLHATMSDPEMRVYGGHLVAAGNPVLATAEVMIYSTPDVRMVKSFDRETGFELFNPS